MIRSPEVLKVLQTAPLFQGVSSKLLVDKLSECRLRLLESGEALLIPGQANNVIYIILSGRLSIQTKESDVEPIAMLGEGECVGEESIIGDVHIPAYVIAATNCKLLAIDHAPLWEMIDSSHQAAHNVISVLSMRIRPATQAMTESHEQHQGFSGTAIIDEMTGLYNRQWLEEKISRYLRRHTYDKKPNCLMMVTIDRFKELGEQYGQLGSEQVLRDTAHNMLECLRPNDEAGHFIDEQFVVLMPHTALPDGCVAAERLRAAIGESVVVLPSGDALPPISVSVGVSPAHPDDTPSSLIARAGEALQQAIGNGGNCVKWSKQETDDKPAHKPEHNKESESAQAPKTETMQTAEDANTVRPAKPFGALWPDKTKPARSTGVE